MTRFYFRIMLLVLLPLFAAACRSMRPMPLTGGDSVAADGFDPARDVALVVILGQSNADGSAFADPALDAEMRQWYVSPANTGRMKIWYRSTEVENQPVNSRGEAPRWVVNGKVCDVAPGWLDLWYRNENVAGRTAMNMIHGFGTYSTGADKAQGRRGIEGELGRQFRTAFPDRDLYVLKLGVSGSHISSWADSTDDHNRTYFMENIYRPAIASLTASGRRPRLAAVWWMQGCADSGSSRDYYETRLRHLIERFRRESGFPDAPFYIGHIVAPGESTACPEGSKGYSEAVRAAQDAVAAGMPGVSVVDTSPFPMQYEEGFGGCIHFSHEGVNAIGRELVRRIAADPDRWVRYVTPGSITTKQQQHPHNIYGK